MLRQLSKLWNHQHWGIGLVHEPVNRFIDPSFTPEVTWLDDPVFAADPFLVTHEGRTAVLFEEFDYRSHAGRISAVELNESGFGQIHRDIIRDEFHFSYPMCVHFDGELYCIPEHSQSTRLAAYRCIRFPDQWIFDRVILDYVPVVDPTIFQHEEQWWMACTRQDREPNSKLLLFHGPTPLGPWTEHSNNPVKKSLSGSRPAGPVFSHDDVLYRPSQDCSKTYGGAVILQRIVTLNPREFAEQTVRTFGPLANTIFRQGMHHIAGLGELTVIDGCRSTFSPHETVRVLKRWGNKILSR